MVKELGRLSVSGGQAESFRNPYFLTPQLSAAKWAPSGERQKARGVKIQNSEA